MHTHTLPTLLPTLSLLLPLCLSSFTLSLILSSFLSLFPLSFRSPRFPSPPTPPLTFSFPFPSPLPPSNTSLPFHLSFPSPLLAASRLTVLSPLPLLWALATSQYFKMRHLYLFCVIFRCLSNPLFPSLCTCISLFSHLYITTSFHLCISLYSISSTSLVLALLPSVLPHFPPSLPTLQPQATVKANCPLVI